MGKEISEQAMKNLVKLMAKQIPKYENAAKKEDESLKEANHEKRTSPTKRR